VKRSVEAEPERYEIRAFLVMKDLSVLGEATGALTKYENKFYNAQIISNNPQPQNDEWKNLEIIPVDVKTAITKEFARNSSSVKSDSADFEGILAGVGALGSALAEIWAKEAWGQWTLIDPDYIKPHNIIRHIAKDSCIGHFKVDVVKNLMEWNYYNGQYSVAAIPDSVTNDNNNLVKVAINAANFLIDATTTLEAPRDLSRKDDVPRLCSIFLTPSGRDSVLLIEDSARRVRLDSLEAQYYRAIINADWGAKHLEGHQGLLSVGAGCRDVSVILSNEAVLLHAATLARQVRLLRDQTEPRMRVWSSDLATGAIVAQEIPVYETVRTTHAAWQIILDTSIQEKLRAIRKAHLPDETGGVILGYIDQKLKAIYVVDVLPAPPDSEADLTGFTRGVDGLESSLQEVGRRTANIIDYIGEWHSHPPSVSEKPSQTDRCLIKKLSEILAQDGLPALMLIVGEAEFSLSVREI
jgi:integrative and conjugative element protein (TIGR02256 family)